MSSDPDPHAASTTLTDTVKVFFMRCYLNVALTAPVPADNPDVIDRLRDLERIEDADRNTLKAEFEAHPYDVYLAKDIAGKADELQTIFGGTTTVTPTPGDATKVRINGGLDFDADELRRMKPSDRKLILDATALPHGTTAEKEAKNKAIYKLFGKLRINVSINATDGKTHLEGLVSDDRRAKLDELYADTSPDPSIQAKYRAWDICNKISPGTDGVALEAKHAEQQVCLNLALDLDPGDLREMVECYEFANMILDEAIKDALDVEAKKLAQARLDQERAEETDRIRNLIPNMEADIAEAKAELDTAKAKIARLELQKKQVPDGPGKDAAIAALDAQLKPLVRTKGILVKGKIPGKEKRLERLRREGLPPEPPPVTATSYTSEERSTALKEIAEGKLGDASAMAALKAKIEATMDVYTAAVSSTGNDPGPCDCPGVGGDPLPNAGAVQRVAANLRFGAARAAAYHSKKHHHELSDTSQTGEYGNKTGIENEVGQYHKSARDAVASGNCVKSQLGQNGGESHLFKGDLVAIVWVKKSKAGLATYFNKST